MAKVNNTDVRESGRRLQDGIKKHFKSSRSITIAGHDYRPEDLVKVLQEEIDAADAVEAARLGWSAAVRTSKELQQNTAPMKRALRGFVASMFGDTSAVLSDFGLKPRKARKAMTVDEKVLVVGKLRATRAARHTMGKRQKQQVVGEATQRGARAGATTAGSSATNGSTTKPPSATP